MGYNTTLLIEIVRKLLSHGLNYELSYEEEYGWQVHVKFMEVHTLLTHLYDDTVAGIIENLFIHDDEEIESMILHIVRENREE